ncbi:MAG: aminotransferase class IV, partial [Thermoleophilaceae bacterium]
PRPSPALGRLRLAVAPDARGGLDVSATVATVDSAIVFPPLEEAPELVPVTIAGGLGSHKWADRRLVEAAAARAGEGATEGAGTLPLIVDQDGSVLEAERASVFAVIDGALFTPPDDGRILPGVTRARVSELARGLGLEVREAGLSLAALADASEVFLTGSVRGIEPVRTTGAPSVTERLATELRSRWLRPAA